MAEAQTPRPCKRCKATPAPYTLRNAPTCRDCYVEYVESKAGRRVGAVARETRTSAAPAPRRYVAGLSFGGSSAVMTHVLDRSAKFLSSGKKGSAAAAFEALVVHVDTDLRPSPPPTRPRSSSPSSSPAAARLLDRYRARFPNVSFECVHLSRALRLRTVDWAALLPAGDAAAVAQQQLERPAERRDDDGDGDDGDRERLRRFLDALPSATARADVTRLLVRHVLLDVALAGAYTALLLGHSTTALAAVTLAEVANGRGFSVPWQVNDGPYPVRTYGSRDGNKTTSNTSDGESALAGGATAAATENPQGEGEKQMPVYYILREVFGAEIAQYLELMPELAELVAASTDISGGAGSGSGSGSIVSHKDLSIAEVMSRYFASVEGPYEGIVANVVRTTGKLDRTSAAGMMCGLCGMTLDGQGDSRWAGELGDDDDDNDNDHAEGDAARRVRLCYGCKRSVNG